MLTFSFRFLSSISFSLWTENMREFLKNGKTSDIMLFLVTFSQDWKININQEVLKKFTYKRQTSMFSLFLSDDHFIQNI